MHEARQHTEHELQHAEAVRRIPSRRPARVSSSSMRQTAALSAKDSRANGDGKPPPVAAGFTVSATVLMALAIAA